jgi:hypothetical protein
MGKPKKGAIRKDNSARIARGAARKARNVAANEDRHLENLQALGSVGIDAGKGKNRPSVQVRSMMRRLGGVERQSVV